MSEPLVHVFPDAQGLATEVARRFLDHVTQVQAERGTAHVVLTGGTIADRVHTEIAQLSPQSDVDWSRVVVWWGDERVVAADSPDRNDIQARRALLDHVNISEDNIRAVPSADVGNVHEAAAGYGYAVASAPEDFDLVMLGIGPDGHVASLFPGHPEVEAQSDAVAVTESPKPPPERVSLTMARLNASHSTWIMASGEGKAEAVAAALGPGDVSEIPARGVRPDGPLEWFLDEDAASRR